MKLTRKAAYAAGQDAGNRNMRNAGRKVWNEDDWNVAAEVTSELLAKLQYEHAS